jgi:hypothetical protein
LFQILTLIASAGLGLAGDKEDARLTLKGFKEIAVVTELDSKIEPFGLTADQLQLDVELRLRTAGINVTKGLPEFLYVNLNALESGLGTYAVALEISFQQWVVPVRNQSIRVLVPTWGLFPIVVTTPKKTYTRFCRDYIADLVDRFINAYMSVNKN